MTENEYETLEIEWRVVEKPKFFLGVGRSQFFAMAIGKEGPYTVAISPTFLAVDRKGTPPITPYEGQNSWSESHKALEALTAALVKDGWELIGTQENWHKQQFRRRTGEVKQQTEPDDVITQLERLNALHQNGGLSDDEFHLAKQRLLGK